MSVNLISEGRDRKRADFQTALVIRCLNNAGAKPETVAREVPESTRIGDWQDFQYATLLDIARECLEWDGVRRDKISGMSNDDIARAALHTTGNFTKLTADAANKSMQVGYTEFPATWLGPMRQAASVPDFKTIHRMRLGAIPNLPIWPDNSDPIQSSMKDAEETYAVEAYSTEISFSFRLLINDDLDAISRMPFQLGSAAKRTINAIAWQQLTDNPTMEDAQALLLETATGNRQRSNLTTGSATPTVTTIGTMKDKMRQMRGENTPEDNESDDILNIEPVYLVLPSALETVGLQLVRSIADPATNLSSAVHNPTRNLIPIIEPRLDANSATAFYLFASPSQIDTIEVTFLQGQEEPQIRSWIDDRSLSQMFAVMQTFGAKAMNHRGIQRHDGV